MLIATARHANSLVSMYSHQPLVAKLAFLIHLHSDGYGTLETFLLTRCLLWSQTY